MRKISFRKNFLGLAVLLAACFALFITENAFAAAAPAGLKTNSVADRAVSLTWNTISQPLDHVAIYCNGEKVKEVYVNGSDNSGYRGAVIRGLEPETLYTFAAKAVYKSGEESGFSNEIQITTLSDSKKNEGQNFAMDAELSASSSNNELLWPKDCVVDGTDAWLNVRNQWLSQWGKGKGAWLTLDFGEIRCVGRWVIKHIGVTGQTYNTVDFDLMISDDGENWTTVKEFRGNSEKITEFVPDNPLRARYFRFLCITPAEAPDGVYARVSEIELYSAIAAVELKAEMNIKALGINDETDAVSVKAVMSDGSEKVLSGGFELESSDENVFSVKDGKITGVGCGTALLRIKYSDGGGLYAKVPLTVSEITVSEVYFENANGSRISSLSGESSVCAKAVVSNKSGADKKLVVLFVYYDENGKMTDVSSSAADGEIKNGEENKLKETDKINISDNGGEAAVYLWKGFGGLGRYAECVKIFH